MDIISAEDLASWLRDPSLEIEGSLIQIVELTNELVTDAWTEPESPVPARIKLLTLNVAARAWVSNPATANVESITRSIDDASRTERYRSTVNDQSLYLTSAELAILQGRRVTNSVRLVVYGDC